MIDRTYIMLGDARKIDLPDRSVQCVVTSPPYWGLRDYGFVGQIGSEKTPEEYVANIVSVFREIKRVLREDGTCWLNLGDSYVASPRGNKPGDFSTSALTNPDRQDDLPRSAKPARIAGLKQKDLIGIPWRVAFALQADGWYLRADIIWAKGVSFCPTYAGSSMPESVTDRPSRTHEYVFLLTKSARYYYDVHAVKETVTSKKGNARSFRGGGAYTKGQSFDNDAQVERETRGNEPNVDGTRNLRSVWTINPKPYPGAHFATFPPALVEPCIKAGTSEHGACSSCGAPYSRIVEKGEPNREQQLACGADAEGKYTGTATKDFDAAGAQDASATKARILAGMLATRTIGWKPGCTCDAPIRPCVVLDPFSGSGTTPATAHTLGRTGIGVEANPEYLILALERLQSVGAI